LQKDGCVLDGAAAELSPHGLKARSGRRHRGKAAGRRGYFAEVGSPACGIAPPGKVILLVFISIRIMQTMQSDVDGGGAFVRGFFAWKGEIEWLMVDR
jgi:hypothetical protein